MTTTGFGARWGDRRGGDGAVAGLRNAMGPFARPRCAGLGALGMATAPTAARSACPSRRARSLPKTAAHVRSFRANVSADA